MSGKLPGLKPREVDRILRKLGFTEDPRRGKGSHRVFVRPSDNRTVVLPWHRGDVKRGLLHQILKDLGLTVEEFLALR